LLERFHAVCNQSVQGELSAHGHGAKLKLRTVMQAVKAHECLASPVHFDPRLPDLQWLRICQLISATMLVHVFEHRMHV
jgi:hypothetical protein